MKTFSDLGISPKLVKGLTELGIINPTEIQEQAIPVLLEKPTDFVGQAQTGTGKTAAYGLPMLELINASKNHVQALVLCPTRELAMQVSKQLFKFTKYSDKIFSETVYGGAQIDKQIKALQRPTHIIVATPGRLVDLIKKKVVDLTNVKTVVLDEADEMLSMGFKKDLDTILSALPATKNRWLFSATLPEGIRQIINSHLSSNAIKIKVSGKNVVNKKIEHKYILVEDADKLTTLLQYLKFKGKERGIVFCKTKNTTKTLAKQLIAKNISADAIHGDLLQKERDKVMRAFKNESLRILVATDLTARGLDVEDLAFVVHYELPSQDEFYTHRSGRTARAGKEGMSLAIVNSKELKQLRFFEKTLGISFSQIRQK